MQPTIPQLPTKQMNVVMPKVPMPQVVRPYVPIPPTVQMTVPYDPKVSVESDKGVNTEAMVNVLEEMKKIMMDQGDKMVKVMTEQREMVRRQENMRKNIIEVMRNQEEMKNTMREIMERQEKLEEEIRENIRMMAIQQEMEIMKIEELQGKIIEGTKTGKGEEEISMTAYTTGYVIITEEMLNRLSEEEMRKMQNRLAKNITTYQQKNPVEKGEQIRKMRENQRIIRGEQEVRRKAKIGVGRIQLQIKKKKKPGGDLKKKKKKKKLRDQRRESESEKIHT